MIIFILGFYYVVIIVSDYEKFKYFYIIILGVKIIEEIY